jgi:hypothetical protein
MKGFASRRELNVVGRGVIPNQVEAVSKSEPEDALPRFQPYRDSQLSRPGQHDRNPVTTKHEKRLYANPCLQ